MELRLYRGAFCLLAYCLLGFSVNARTEPVDASIKSSSIKVAGVPPGFQFLMEKQTTAIDVFYGDVYLTTTLASYTPTTVEFHNPEEVVERLNNLLSPQQVAQGLTGDIDSHSGEVCYRGTDTDCGVLTPDSVGVIFDEGRFRADVFINPNLLSVQQVNFNRYLPLSESEFSNINNLSLIYTGGDIGDDQVSLNSQTLFGYKQQRVVSNWSYADSSAGSQFSMSTLYWQMDDRDFQYQAGWFNSETRFLSFIPSLSLMGFRYSTSFKARTDLDFTNGIPVQVFLVSRSVVNLYKDGLLVSSAFYNPGNQILDTSNLPDGAYDIEIEITDTSGRKEPRITRFYVKSQRLAPNDQDLYFFEAGKVQTYSAASSFPKSVGIEVIQGGYSHRLTADLGLNVGGSMTESELVTETGLYFVNNWYDLEPKMLLSTSGDYGWSLNGYARYQEWFGSYQFRRIWSDHENSSNFHLIPAALKQHQLGLSHELWAGYAQVRYAVSEQSGVSTRLAGLSYTKPFSVWNSYFNFSADFTKSDKDTIILFGVNTNWFQGHIQHSVSTDIRHEKSDLNGTGNYVRAGYNGSWIDDEWRPEDISMQWHAEADSLRTTAGAQGEIQNYLGSARLGVDYSQTDLTDNYQYAGQLTTSIAGEKGTWGVGGKNSAVGALIVEVDTDEAVLSGYDVYINGLKYGEIQAGKKVVVPVAAYQTYRVRLADKGSNYVAFESEEKVIAIYPGNVKALKWEAKSLGIFVARIVHKLPGCFNDDDPKCWSPLIYAKAKNVNDFAATDSEGFIQVEVYKSSKNFTLVRKGRECKVDFSKAEFTDNLAYIEEDVKCYDVE